jgi:hypothetical protein
VTRGLAFVLAIAGALGAVGARWSPRGGGVPRDVEAALAAAVLDADAHIVTDADALDAERLIERTVRARPGRAGDLARLLPSLRNRPLAFRLALFLGRKQGEPAVRAALLDDLRRGGNHAREVTAYCFYGLRGDREVADALAAGFLDEAADPRVRAAQGWALAGMIMDLPAGRREAVRACARRVAGAGTGDVPLRVEAIGLLDVVGVDRAAVREYLAKDPERNVALSAARVLLRSGEAERTVHAGLERFAGDQDLTAKALRDILEGSERP